MATAQLGDEFLKSGDLEGARKALVETVQRAPNDTGARMFLWQLMAICGDWDRAAAQLRTLAQIMPAAQMLSTVYSQAMKAEKAAPRPTRAPRRFRAGPVLGLGGDPGGGPERRRARRSGRGRAPARRGVRCGRRDAGAIDGETFLWIADGDSRLGPCFEAIVGDRWGLVPFEAVTLLKTEGPKDLRDLVWLPAELSLRSGQSAAALLPARYPGPRLPRRRCDWRARRCGPGRLRRPSRRPAGVGHQRGPGGRRSRLPRTGHGVAAHGRSEAQRQPVRQAHINDRIVAIVDDGRAAVQLEGGTQVQVRSADQLGRFNEAAMRDSVRRELTWLLNTVNLEPRSIWRAIRRCAPRC